MGWKVPSLELALSMTHTIDCMMSVTGVIFSYEQLTIGGVFIPDNRLGYFPFDLLEEFSASL